MTLHSLFDGHAPFVCVYDVGIVIILEIYILHIVVTFIRLLRSMSAMEKVTCLQATGQPVPLTLLQQAEAENDVHRFEVVVLSN